MELLTLLQKCVILSQSLQGELIGDFDVLGVGDVALLEVADLNWVSRTEEADLLISRHHFKDVLDNFLELARDESVDLVKNDKFALVKFSFSTRGQIEDSTGSCHDNVDGLPHTNHVFVHAGTTS